MSDPERLLAECRDEFKLDLLRSWHAEHPSPTAFRRTACALGVSASAGAATAAATGSAGIVGGGSGMIPATAAVILKWCALGALCGAALTSGTSVVISSLKQACPTQAAALPPIVDTHAKSAAKAAASAVAGWTRTGDAPVTAVRRTDRPPPAPVRPGLVATADSANALDSSINSRDSIADEISLLDRARVALRQNDPQLALTELDRLTKRSRSGTFTPEAMLVRIEALRMSSRTVEARQLASRFLKLYPQSPSAPTVQRWLDQP